MGKSLHLDRDHRIISADIHLLQVGKMILVSFIARFTAVFAKVKKIWAVAKIRRYDQRVFWPGSIACFGLAIMTIIVIGQDQGKTPNLQSHLLFVNCFIFFLFYDFLQIVKKDENGQSHWL